jgi:hypothetical protein
MWKLLAISTLSMVKARLIGEDPWTWSPVIVEDACGSCIEDVSTFKSLLNNTNLTRKLVNGCMSTKNPGACEMALKYAFSVIEEVDPEAVCEYVNLCPKEEDLE